MSALRSSKGEVLGIIGRNSDNGSRAGDEGKSTLLQNPEPNHRADAGASDPAGGRMASLLEVGTGFHPGLIDRENVFLDGAILPAPGVLERLVPR